MTCRGDMMFDQSKIDTEEGVPDLENLNAQEEKRSVKGENASTSAPSPNSVPPLGTKRRVSSQDPVVQPPASSEVPESQEKVDGSAVTASPPVDLNSDSFV
mgnify:CR=1 FL=1